MFLSGTSKTEVREIIVKPQFATSQEGRYMASTKKKAEIVPVTIQVNDIGNLIYTIRDREMKD